MNKKVILAIVRHTLTFVGGILIAKGTLDEAMAQELVGGIMAVIGGVWSVLDKKD